MESKVLLVSTDRESREVLPGALRSHAPSWVVEVASRAAEAVERLAGGFDAIVCCVDSVEELTLVLRLRKHDPELPLVVLSRVAQEGFETVAKARGADACVRKPSGLAQTAREVVLATTTVRLARQNRSLVARSRVLVDEMRLLFSRNRDLVATALGLAAAEQETFATLLVEDDDLQARLLVRLFAGAKLPPFLRCVATVPEAIDYLTGGGRFADRSAYPFPALIVSDLRLPGRSGLDLLRWVRANPQTRTLGFVMLTASEDERDIEAAFAEGADLYLVKSLSLEYAVEFVRGVYVRFLAAKRERGTS